MATKRRSISELMALEVIGPDTYMSKSSAWSPGGRGAAYGGHVFAQCVWAACQTIAEGMIIHNTHGYFTLPGRVDRPYIFTVEHVSEGRSYCTRAVTVRQPKTASTCNTDWELPTAPFDVSDASKPLSNICFKALCSFKRDEPYDIGHQETKEMRKEYAAVLKGKWPKDHAYCPSVDAPWFIQYEKEYDISPTVPALDMRKVDMAAFNSGKPTINYRQLTLYRTLAPIPESNSNLHAVAHLYASDRNSLFLISNALEFPSKVDKMASLSHSVIFHVDSKRLTLPFVESDEASDQGWFFQEAWTPRSEAGRGIHESKIWDANGLHIASSFQDGLVRRASGEVAKQMDGYMQVHKNKL